ncbi:hypothetical protein [Aurantiacibacter spongiae]|uniref:Uncharacterized protein n=1 Tax=Aurantiacibacter spongiae TaxID=2488860 RepID=A0A3N5CPX4_9SPHN|nr:hypothetical protein [Aurantiacibacter spongiae]RPF71054.1 hypothetical protein EG799_05080 [Aurantiacibacter spongiae]
MAKTFALSGTSPEFPRRSVLIAVAALPVAAGAGWWELGRGKPTVQVAPGLFHDPGQTAGVRFAEAVRQGSARSLALTGDAAAAVRPTLRARPRIVAGLASYRLANPVIAQLGEAGYALAAQLSPSSNGSCEAFTCQAEWNAFNRAIVGAGGYWPEAFGLWATGFQIGVPPEVQISEPVDRSDEVAGWVMMRA